MQVFVFYPEEEKVGVKTIKTYAERMRNEGVNRAVMVTQVNMTPFARQCLQEMAPKYYIEVVGPPCGLEHASAAASAACLGCATTDASSGVLSVCAHITNSRCYCQYVRLQSVTGDLHLALSCAVQRSGAPHKHHKACAGPGAQAAHPRGEADSLG